MKESLHEKVYNDSKEQLHVLHNIQVPFFFHFVKQYALYYNNFFPLEGDLPG